MFPVYNLPLLEGGFRKKSLEVKRAIAIPSPRSPDLPGFLQTMKSLHAVHQFLAIINFLFRLRLQIHTDCLSSEKSNCLATNLKYALYKYKAFSPDNIGMLCSKLRSSFFCKDFPCLYGSQNCSKSSRAICASSL